MFWKHSAALPFFCVSVRYCESNVFPFWLPEKNKCKTNQLNIAKDKNTFYAPHPRPPHPLHLWKTCTPDRPVDVQRRLFLFVDKHKQMTETYTERLNTLICVSVLPASNNNWNSPRLKDLCHETLLVNVCSCYERGKKTIKQKSVFAIIKRCSCRCWRLLSSHGADKANLWIFLWNK